MARKIPPCYKCEKRSASCHGSCEDYKAYRSQIRSIHDIRQEAHDKSVMLNSFKYDTLNKNLKRSGAKK